MVKNSVSDWDEAASNNSDIAGLDIAENCDPANINDSDRNIMAQVAAYTRHSGSGLASAATLNLDSVGRLFIDITGTTTVTAVTLSEGHVRFCRADAAFQLTASASLIINGSTSDNYTTKSGDLLFFQGYASSVVEVTVTGKPSAYLADIEALSPSEGDFIYFDGTDFVTFRPTFGQCQLVHTNTSTITLERFNGKWLTIDGKPEEIPSAGVTLSNSGLSDSTVYYIYAYMDSGTMTLEASTTTHATHTDGVEIKSGDSTRTLVGMVYLLSGNFQNATYYRYTRSWYNRSLVPLHSWFTAIRSTASTSWVEMNSEIRVRFLVWEDEHVILSSTSSWRNDTGSTYIYGAIGLDGTSSKASGGVRAYFNSSINNIPQCMAIADQQWSPSEGFHYATLIGTVSGGTGYWETSANADGQRTALDGFIVQGAR